MRARDMENECCIHSDTFIWPQWPELIQSEARDRKIWDLPHGYSDPRIELFASAFSGDRQSNEWEVEQPGEKWCPNWMQLLCVED